MNSARNQLFNITLISTLILFIFVLIMERWLEQIQLQT